MSLWKDASGNLHDDMGGRALSLPSWPSGLTLLTTAQADAMQSTQRPTAQLSAQQWAAYQAQARATLAASDTTMHRVGEGVALGRTAWTAADVVAFVQWRQALRSILSQAQPSAIPASLPAQPAYPAGT